MIKTERGEVLIKGNVVEIAADLLVIFKTVLQESPISLVAALMEFEENLTEEETNERIKALASVLSQLPKEELEALKKKAGWKNEDNN